MSKANGKVDTSAMRTATTHPFPADLVESHLLLERVGDQLFKNAWRYGLHTLSHDQRRGQLPGVIGHIAESIIESILVELGYTPLWHFRSTGGHGVDLLLVTPSFDGVLAIEVKGTLRARRWPSLRGARLNQMTPEWLDSIDNPGMNEWDLTAVNIYGAVFLINLADLLLKAGVTEDFKQIIPLDHLEDLADLCLLDHR